MSTSGTSVPVLVAAFVFGIVVNAASAALFLHVNSHGSTVFRDGQRLVLTTFLLGAALWAQTDFISIAIDPTATSSCQIGIIFSTFFDQLARFSIEQYLLWAINKGAKSGVQQMIVQALVITRFVVGCVFVGFSRPQFDPVCVPMSSMMPVAIVVVVLDVVLIATLAIMAIMAGLMSDVREDNAEAGRSKSILLVIVAFTIWTATSVIMLLGMSSSDLLLRTLLPAIGLLILVFIITACNDPLTSGTTKSSRAPDSPGIRNITTGRSISTDASSDYPPSRFEDIKRSEILTMSAFEQPREAPRPDIPPVPSNFSRPVVMLANVEAPPLVVQNEAFIPGVSAFAAAAAASNTRKIDIRPQGGKTKRSLLDLKGGPGAARGGKIMISNPILEANGDQNPLNKIATISLEEAARGERERRANDLNLQRDSALIAKRPAPQPPNMSTEEAIKRSISLKRKEVASVSSQPPMPTASSLEPMPVATTSSAQLSPGVEELRRRSPRQPPVDKEASQSMRAKSVAMPSAPSPTIPLPSPQQEMPQQMNFTVEPNRAASAFIIQPSGFAPPVRPARPDADLPPPPVGTDASVRRPEIRPSRQLKSPTQPAPEPEKPALLRRPTNGLPGNPRAMAMKALNEESGAGRQQTVMFMNNIVYDNPERVQDIINDASSKEAGRRSTQSIVHRPRPIPRHLEKDRAIFPAEPSPNLAGHRRSKSGGSIVGRKSILLSNPGSPTQLPPLPLPPKNMGYNLARPSADRPQPNNTKSMTFDEKMTLLFPTPPSGESMARRRSSVPEMPVMPLDYMPIILSPTAGQDRDSRMSQSTNRTGRTSIKTENILEVDELPRRGEDVSRLNEEVGSAWLPGLAGNSMVMSMSDAAMRPSMGATSMTTGGRKRASSPVLPPTRDSAMTMSSDARTHDDATTNWGSVHSPVVAVPIPANRQVARTTYINGGERGEGRNPAASAEPAGLTAPPAAPAAALALKEKDNSGPLLPLLPATTYNAARSISPPTSDEDSGKQSKNVQKAEKAQNSQKRESQWHRRVGDDTLSFSERKERVRSRMPPPTPLLLNPSSTKNPVIVKAAEPSPLESPEQALAYIQEQLKRYEEPNLAVTAEETPTRRLALLENLEREMDMQAGHWQEMQHDLRHDSLSSMQTLSPSAESRRQSVISSHNVAVAPVAVPQQQQPVKESVAIHIGADRRAARRSRIQASTWNKHTTEDIVLPGIRNSANKKKPFSNAVIDLGALGSPTPPDSDEDDLDLRLHRPYDAVDEIAFSNSVTKALSQKTTQTTQKTHKPSLWTPAAKPATMTTTTLLWTPAPAVQSRQPTVLFASISIAQQPAHASAKKSKAGKKQLSGPLPIESVTLWNKQHANEKSYVAHSGRGLWMSHSQSKPVQVQHSAVASMTPVSEPALSEEELMMKKMQDLESEMDAMEADREERIQASQKPPRPLTQRPPRRNKRVTMLPDILESPKPLPDKRGTLGIFQFPWGEKSDTAKLPTLPTRGPFGAMPGTMASGGGQLNAALEARSRELEASEYSSSFFDDYDDEEDYDDDDDNGFDEDGSGSDDGFDETTLWEIASLLKTEQVPSTLSMFPPPLSSGSVMGDYIEDMPMDNETEHLNEIANNSYVDVDEVLAEMTSEVRADNNRDSQLWNDNQDARNVAEKKTSKDFSMAQPDEETWKGYDTVSQAATLRSKPRQSESAKIETSQLWDREASIKAVTSLKTLPANPRSSLWAAAQQKKKESEKKAASVKQQVDSKMWTPQAKQTKAAKADNKTALFDKEAAAAAKMETAVIRTTDMEPAALNMPRTPRTPNHAPLEKLMSTSLWTSANGKSSKMWAPKPVAKVTAKGPLFDCDVAAVEKLNKPIRTTDKEPAALNMPRTPRTPSRAPLEKLASTSLWTASSGKPSKMWALKPVARVRAKGPLFDRDVAAVEKLNMPVRTTDKEPAALNMPRTPRTPSRAPLEKLMSSSLWTSASGHSSRMWAPMPVPKIQAKGFLFDRDVAAVQKLTMPIRTTTMEPAAVDMIRVPRSLSHMPQLRLESTALWSVAETSTHHVQKKAEINWILAKDPKTLPVVVDDTIPASSVGVKQKTWWEKMKAAAGVSSAPEPAKPAPLAVAEAKIDNVRMALKTTPLLPPVSQQEQYLPRPVASRSDWEGALKEAVAASYPWMQRRISATPNQWQSALDQALARSYPFDAARQHPVLAGSSSSDSSVMNNDASKVHPVFFQPESVEEPKETVIQLVQSQPSAQSTPAQSDAAYNAHIVAMENQALARLQALESAGHGVVLRY